MSLPTSNKTGTLDFTWRGLPQNSVASKTAVNTGTLDYTWRGIPFNGNPAPSSGAVGVRLYGFISG